MPPRVILLPNLHAMPGDHAAGGMEFSTQELFPELRRLLCAAGYSVLVLRAKPRDYPLNRSFRTPQDRNETRISTALNSLSPPLSTNDILLDNTTSISASRIAVHRHSRVVRTIRLDPAHWTYRHTAPYTTAAVHISRFAQQRDSFHARTRIIRDPVVLPQRIPHNVLSTPKHYAVSIGRVLASKGHLPAARIAKALSLPLFVIGPILDRTLARQLTAEAHVTLLGGHTRLATLSVLRSASYLLWLPTSPEPAGRVVIESLRLRVPVLGANFGNLWDAVHFGETCIHTTISGHTLVRVHSLPSFLPRSPATSAAAYVDLVHQVASQQ